MSCEVSSRSTACWSVAGLALGARRPHAVQSADTRGPGPGPTPRAPAAPRNTDHRPIADCPLFPDRFKFRSYNTTPGSQSRIQGDGVGEWETGHLLPFPPSSEEGRRLVGRQFTSPHPCL